MHIRYRGDLFNKFKNFIFFPLVIGFFAGAGQYIGNYWLSIRVGNLIRDATSKTKDCLELYYRN